MKDCLATDHTQQYAVLSDGWELLRSNSPSKSTKCVWGDQEVFINQLQLW